MKFYKLLFISLCFVANGFAQIATPLVSPTASSSVSTGIPTSNGAWSTVSGVLVVGGINAVSTTFTIDGQTSDNIITSNYDFSIIPALATIVGIEAQVVRQTSLASASNITDWEVRLLKAGVPVGFNQANQVGTWPTLGSETAGVYGGPAELWSTTWTLAEITDPGFGLLFSARRINVFGALDQNAFVNSIQLRVYYTLPLPIVLSNFEIKKLSTTSSLISWVTEQEVNVREYEVQRSANGVDFSSIGKIIPSSPNSNKEQKYSLQDNNPFPGKNYYRLKQTDLDGKFQIFSVKSISLDSKDEYFKITQPASNRIRISSANKKGSYSVQIRDTQGRLLQNQTLQLEGTVNDSYLNLNPNVKGIVFITMVGAQENQTFRLFIQ